MFRDPRWLVAVVPLVLVPAPARAQTPPVPGLAPDSLVWVTTTGGREQQGQVQSVSPSMLRISGLTGELSIDWSDIGLVEADVQDPIANGVWNGALTGALSTAGFAGFVVALVCSIEGCDASDVTRFALVWTGIGGGAGAVAGAAIDRARPTRQVVYPREGRTALGSLRLGERVLVTTTDGRRVQGKLLEASGSSMALAAGGARLGVSLADVQSIAVERADGLGNGIRNGIMAGAGAMAGMLIVGQSSSGSCCEPITTLYWTAVGGGIGALAGAGVDALLHSQSLVYQPGGRPSPAVLIAPVIQRSGAGVRLSVRW